MVSTLIDIEFEGNAYVMEISRTTTNKLYITMTETTTSTMDRDDGKYGPNTFDLEEIDA